MKQKKTLIFIALLLLPLSLFAHSLDLFRLPLLQKDILWPEVGREALEVERNGFELEGPDDRNLKLELEGEKRGFHLRSDESFLSHELGKIEKDEEKDLEEEGKEYKILTRYSDSVLYILEYEVADRFGIYYVSYLGVLSDGMYLEFEAKYQKEDSFLVEKVMDSLASLHQA